MVFYDKYKIDNITCYQFFREDNVHNGGKIKFC